MRSATPPAEQTPSEQSVSPRARRRSRWWLLLWVPVALLGLALAAGVGLWVWAGSPGSLAQTLSWAQRWTEDRAESVGQLNIRQVQGSLRSGGQIGDLTWSLDGLTVQARGVRIDWDNALWLNALMGRGVHLQGLAIDALRINDQRPPGPETEEPAAPLQELRLPLPVSLPWSVKRFTLEGNTTLTLSGAQGRYRYGPMPVEGTPALPDPHGSTAGTDTHQLVLEALEFADGRYRAQLTLGGAAPMPLALDLQGELEATVPGANGTEGTGATPAIKMQATATARGTLGGADAALDITAEVQTEPGTTEEAGAAPALQAAARVMPWAPQPLLSASASTQALDLAALWPQAPSTSLTGSLKAEPDGDVWRAQLDLTNANSGPADQQRLPLERLQVALTQAGTRWTLERLDAQLAGGQLQGTAQADVTTGADATQVTNWQGALQASNIRPSLIWSELAAGALGGEFSARAVEGTTQAMDLQARVQPASSRPGSANASGDGPLNPLRLEELRLQGRWTPGAGTPTQGVLDLQTARVAMAGATLNAQGRLDTVALTYTGQVDARLPGASAQIEGELAHAKGSGAVNVRLSDAARVLEWLRGLQTLPIVGSPLKAFLDAQAGLAATGSARLDASWQGGLGALGYPAPASTPAAGASAPSPRLQAALVVPRLAVQTGSTAPITLSDWRLQARGGLNDLQLELNGTATQAPWRANLQSSGQLTQTQGAWQSGLLALSRLQLRVDQPEQTTAASSWSLQAAQPIRLQWETDARGLALDAGAGQLQVRPDNAVERHGAAAATAPTLAWESLVWRAGVLQTQGQVRGLPLSWVDSLSTVDAGGQPPLRAAGLGGDLVFNGQWDVLLPSDAAQPVRLNVSLQRTSGDLLLLSDRAVAMAGAAQANANGASRTSASGRSTVTLPANNGSNGSQPVAAGVREASIDLGVQGRTVRARLRWDSAQLGQASADLSTELATPAAAGAAPADASALDRWWPASAPISGTASARLPQVGVWSALAPPGWRVRGTLAADATISGTRGAPEWRGNLQADELAVRSVVDGFFFSGGQMRATLTGDRLTIERFSINGPRGAERGGTLTAAGTAEWRRVEGSDLRQPFIDLTVNANRLRVAARADRRLTLTGEINATLAGPQLQLRGQLKADSALFVLPDESTPSLSDDVVVRTTRTLEVQPTLAERVKADVSVDLDLGDQFMVRGQGLETRLAGALNVRSTPETPTPRITGEVRTVSGTYRAYGQQLNIETGALRFTGPYDNPSLDILAVRKLPEATGQRVGVQITGSAQVPRVRLFSDPELPDSEKLAWLVLGRPASAAGAQSFVLQQAARTLLAGNKDLADGDLAQTFGLDEVGFQGETTAADGSTTEAAFTLGKRLSEDFYLSYEHSLSSAMSTVSIFYDLSRRLTLRARAGTENAVDLIFTVQYD